MKKACSILLVFAMVLGMTMGAFALEPISEGYRVDSFVVAEAQALLSSISKSDIFDEITDSVHKMRFSETYTAVKKQRIVSIRRCLRNCKRSTLCKAV